MPDGTGLLDLELTYEGLKLLTPERLMELWRNLELTYEGLKYNCVNSGSASYKWIQSLPMRD